MVKNKIRDWLEVRIGLDELVKTQLTEYRVPKQINVFNTLGSVALAGYLIQVISGIFLLIYYIPHSDHAFRSVQDIMTNVPYGWLFRQIHVAGSNLMITAVTLHMITIFLMGNYKRPRELTWIGGSLMLVIYVSLRTERLSIALDTAQLLGNDCCDIFAHGISGNRRFHYPAPARWRLCDWITLSRFFAVHVSILPPLFLILMIAHIALIRRIGLSATPFGKSDEEKRPLTEFRKKTHPEGQPYYPYLFQKQALMVIGYFIVMFCDNHICTEVLFP